jgi:hypothetical protein
MRCDGPPDRRRTKLLVLLVVLVVGLMASTGTATASGGAAPLATAATNCAQVNVSVTVRGNRVEGSATQVRVSQLSCRTGRSVLRYCLLYGRPEGWRIRFFPARSRVTLTRGRQVIGYTPAGGGKCI